MPVEDASSSPPPPPPPKLELAFLPDETLVWQKGAVVGGGRFGQLLVALRVPSAELVAVKQLFVQEELEQGNDVSFLSLQRVQTRAHIERELDIVRDLRHENIVRVLGAERQGPVVHIFMEYLPLGSVSKQLKEFGPLEEPTIRRYARHVLQGVAYLHALGIAHRDLKCANLLLAADGVVKIADFGAAKRASHGRSVPREDRAGDRRSDERRSSSNGGGGGGRADTARSVREGLGTPYWMAPELVRAEKGDDEWQKADVWGVGCVVVEMATGSSPWANLSNPLTAMFQIASATAVPLVPSHLSAAAHAFLSRCFVKDPARRASAAELLQHPFLAGHGGSADCHEPSDAAMAAGSPEAQGGDYGPPPTARGTTERASDASPAHSDGEEDARGVVEPLAAGASLAHVRAIAAYAAEDASELTLREGDVVEVTETAPSGWWRGRRLDPSGLAAGWFPSTYVERVGVCADAPLHSPR